MRFTILPPVGARVSNPDYLITSNTNPEFNNATSYWPV